MGHFMTLTTSSTVTFILSSDHKANSAWYSDVLGLAQLEQDPFGTVFRLGGPSSNAILRLTSVPDFKPSGHTVLGFSVDSLEPHMEALKAKGVTFLVYEGFGQDANGIWSDTEHKARLVWFNDPEGNNLMLAEKK